MINRRKKIISEINITPFVDFWLVILLIFMVTAPILNTGFDVSLPRASKNVVSSKDDSKKIILTIDRTEGIYLENKLIKIQNLDRTLKSYSKLSTQIFIKADKSVKYQGVITLMSELNKLGFQNISLITITE